MKRKRIKRANPVAKYGRRFNKAQVFRDRTKYRRKTKHTLKRLQDD